MRSDSILLIPLFKGYTVTTNGTEESKTWLELDVPQVRNLLPYCDALFLITLTEIAATDTIDWNIAFSSGFDRNHELISGPFDISNGVNITAPGSFRSGDYSTTSNFLLESRLHLWWQNHDNVSGAKTAILSAVLGAKLRQS